MKTKIGTGGTPKLPFSQAIVGGNFIFTSGQVYLKDGKLLEGSIEEQTHQVMKNLNNHPLKRVDFYWA